MKRLLGVFLSMTLAVSLMAGCGGASGGGTEQSQSAEETAAEDQSEAEEAAVSQDQADAAAADGAEGADQADAAAADSTASAEVAAADATAAGEVAAADITAAAAAKDGQLQALSVPDLNLGGGLKEPEEMEEPEEMTEEDTEKMDRAMRAYTPPADSLLKNEAESFYYYDQMDKTEQTIYDALYMCATDPTDTNNAIVATIGVDPTTREFAEKEFKARYGMLYDHPELFWLYNESECKISVGAPRAQQGNGRYTVYFYYKEPYEDFEEKMNEFNDAAEAFLEEIDLTVSDAEIARQIHDRLIETVTYDTPVMYDEGGNGFRNLAHTAYGALVEDSEGNKNCAVCDGYSQAYVYLLQQAGIEATVMVGIAGSSRMNAGGHAWSLVKLDGDWYEVDSTWDDAGTLEETVEGIKTSDPYSYGYFKEALMDPDYRNKLQHYLCNLTTPEIENFTVDDYFAYQSKDQLQRFAMVNDSVHIRAGDGTGGYDLYGLVVGMAPQAEGTTYKMR